MSLFKKKMLHIRLGHLNEHTYVNTREVDIKTDNTNIIIDIFESIRKLQKKNIDNHTFSVIKAQFTDEKPKKS